MGGLSTHHNPIVQWTRTSHSLSSHCGGCDTAHSIAWHGMACMHGRYAPDTTSMAVLDQISSNYVVLCHSQTRHLAGLCDERLGSEAVQAFVAKYNSHRISAGCTNKGPKLCASSRRALFLVRGLFPVSHVPLVSSLVEAWDACDSTAGSKEPVNWPGFIIHDS